LEFGLPLPRYLMLYFFFNLRIFFFSGFDIAVGYLKGKRAQFSPSENPSIVSLTPRTPLFSGKA
jgi:hypothetical protein